MDGRKRNFSPVWRKRAPGGRLRVLRLILA